MPFDAPEQPEFDVAVTLERMRALLRTPRQWLKFSICRGGRACLMGAAYLSVGADPGVDCLDLEAELLVRPVFRHLQTHLPPGFVDLAAFNDAVGTHHSDVMALLDRALAGLRVPCDAPANHDMRQIVQPNRDLIEVAAMARSRSARARAKSAQFGAAVAT